MNGIVNKLHKYGIINYIIISVNLNIWNYLQDIINNKYMKRFVSKSAFMVFSTF